MKLTMSQFKQLIKEEVKKQLTLKESKFKTGQTVISKNRPPRIEKE